MIIWQLKRTIQRMAIYYRDNLADKCDSYLDRLLNSSNPHFHNAKAIGQCIKKLVEFRRTGAFIHMMLEYLSENRKESNMDNMNR